MRRLLKLAALLGLTTPNTPAFKSASKTRNGGTRTGAAAAKRAARKRRNIIKHRRSAA